MGCGFAFWFGGAGFEKGVRFGGLVAFFFWGGGAWFKGFFRLFGGWLKSLFCFNSVGLHLLLEGICFLCVFSSGEGWLRQCKVLFAWVKFVWFGLIWLFALNECFFWCLVLVLFYVPFAWFYVAQIYPKKQHRAFNIFSGVLPELFAISKFSLF